MSFSRWYAIPSQIALWEALEALGQAEMKVLHCDPEQGWVLADCRSFLFDLGLVDLSVKPHPTQGAFVTLTAEAYWSSNVAMMASSFDDLVRRLDHRMAWRAHHYSAAIRDAQARGVRFDVERGTDLSSRARRMRRPRAKGAILVSVLSAALFLLIVPLQDSRMGVMLFMALASPFLLCAVVIAASRFAEGGMFLLVAGLGIGLIFFLFTFLLTLVIVLPSIKGATRSFAAGVQRERYDRLAEGTRSVLRTIEIEHKGF